MDSLDIALRRTMADMAKVKVHGGTIGTRADCEDCTHRYHCDNYLDFGRPPNGRSCSMYTSRRLYVGRGDF